MRTYGLTAAPPSKNIYVAGLPQDIDDARLKEVFAAYGEVVWVKVLREGRDGRMPGIVEFSNLEHATWVVANVNGGIPQGLSEPVDVKFKDEKGPYAEGGMGGMGGMGMGMGMGMGKGYGPGFDGAKGQNRYSPYGPPDSTGFDAMFAQAFAAAGVGQQQKGAGGKGHDKGPPEPSDKVYIKGLPITCDDALLKQVFSAFGSVTQCRVCPGGETKRTALVRFSSIAESQACMTGCNGQSPPVGLVEPVEVRFADTWDSKQKRNSDGTEFSIEVIVKGFESSGLMPGGVGRYDSNANCALYIAGLPNDTTDYHLFKLFSPLGPIAPRGVRALLNEDGTCKGIAFVNYQREDSVHAAIAVYHGAILPDGSKLKVQQKAQKPPPQVCHPPPTGGQHGQQSDQHQVSNRNWAHTQQLPPRPAGDGANTSGTTSAAPAAAPPADAPAGGAASGGQSSGSAPGPSDPPGLGGGAQVVS